MKKIAIILLSILVAGMFIACNQDVTIDAQTYANMELGTFVLNGNNYATLQAAIDALSTPKSIGDNDGVIYLTKDASGPGAVIDGVAGVKIDFGPNTYSFTNVTATQGSTEGSFGLTVKGGAKVTLAGTKAMNLVDKTTGLTMVYVEGEGTSLAVEQAPEMSVADDQFVFWAANGATLTIGGETKVSGSIAATGTTATPKVIVTESAAIAVPEMKTENAAVLLNTSGDTAVTKISATDTVVVVTGTGDVSVETAGTTSNLNIQNLSGNGVSLADQTLDPNFQVTVTDGTPGNVDDADPTAAEKIIENLPIFESGKGTKDDPYIIKTAAQLEMFRDSVNLGDEDYKGKFIKLDADITISGAWTPIGNSARTNDNSETRVFSGTFDGNGKTITGLTNEGYTPTILRGGDEYVFGLFGVVNGATIKDLTLADVSIETYKDSGAKKSGIQGDCVGALVGYAVGSADISGCIVESGSVQGYSAVGGLIGRMYGANETSGTLKVEECKNYAYVEGYEHVGGLIGWLNGSPREGKAENTITLAKCENYGNVKDAGDGVSGVAGIAVFGLEPREWTLSVTDCSNYGNISREEAGNAAYVICCDNGHDQYRGEYLKATFNDNSNHGNYEGPELKRLIFVVSAMGVDNYGKWDYTGENYKEYNVSTKYDGGKGTEEDPYLIGSESTLKFFRDQVNGGEAYSGTYFILTDNITLTEDWTPIGKSYRGEENGKYFAGTFDGNSKTISGLTLSENNTSAVAVDGAGEYVFGLFGVVKGATIKNLTMTNVNINKVINNSKGVFTYYGENVAAVVGYSEGNLTLDGITVGAESEDNSTIKGAHVAGIISRAYGKTEGAKIVIKDCKNYATITASDGVDNKAKAAGIIAFANPYGKGVSVSITGCENHGDISSEATVHVIASGIVNYGYSNNAVDDGEDITVSGNTNTAEITCEKFKNDTMVSIHQIAALCSYPATGEDQCLIKDNTASGSTHINELK